MLTAANKGNTLFGTAWPKLFKVKVNLELGFKRTAIIKQGFLAQ